MASVAKPRARRQKGRPVPVLSTKLEDRGIRRWIAALGITAVFVIAFELYAPAMHGSFLFDDLALPFHKEIAHAPLRAWLSGVRPLLMFTYWVNYTLSGRSPDSYHLVNIFLHAINTCLVFWILLRLLTWAKWNPKNARLAALIGAAVFLVHPLQTESVSYIAGRSESLAALFVLAAYTVFIYRRGPGVSWAEAVAVILLFGMAVLTKENSVALAGWLVLTDLFWPGDGWWRQLRRNWRLYALLIPLAAGALIVVIRVLAHSKSAGFSVAGVTWYDYGLTQARAIFAYAGLFLLPLRLSVDHEFAISHSLTAHGAIFFVAAVAALTAAALLWRRRFRLAAFGVLLWLALLAPTSSIIPLNDVFVERRMYLPLLGLILLGCEALHRWKPPRAIMAGLIGGFLVFSALLTYQRNELWGDPPRLWMQAIDAAPAKYRPYINLVSASIQDQRCDASIPYLERALTRFPKNARVVESYGRLLECVGRREEALQQMQRAAILDPHSWVYEWIGLLYGEMGHSAEAGAALHHAVELKPDSVSAHDALALWYESVQQNGAALAEYRQSLSLDGNDAVAQRAVARLEASGLR